MSAWTAIVGAARWATCERASDEEIERRAAICSTCSSRVVMRVRGTEIVAAFCGQPFVATATTCGCLVGWARSSGEPSPATIATSPAGKPTCRGERCPAGRWTA